MKHIVCAVIRDGENYVISKRADDVHQGGKWEFPGGKVEVGESAEAAIVRECYEELSISLNTPRLIGCFNYEYGELALQFSVFWADSFSGTATGMEGQRVETVSLAELKARTFPDANYQIFNMIDRELSCNGKD